MQTQAHNDQPHINCIRAEQIRLTYEQLPTLTMSNILGSTVLAFVMWGKISPVLITCWITVLFSMIAFGLLVILKRYNRVAKNNPNHLFWGRVLVVYVFIRALVWGLAGILFYVPDSLEYQILLLLFVIGGAGLVAVQAAAYRPAFYFITMPVILPVAIRFAWDLDALHLAISFITLVYAWALAYFYQNIYRNIKESLLLRFDKASLAEKLELQKQAVEQAYEDKSKFIAAVSHDLRQPLHAQGLFVAELKQRVVDARSMEIIEKLESSFNSMYSLFNSVLDMSKLDANAIVPVVKQFPVSQILKEIKLDFDAEAKRKGLRLKMIDCSAWVESDAQLINRIIRNLVSNAVQYTDKGQVLLGCRRKNDYLLIQVVDTGIGIAKNQLQSIFQEYHQLNVSNHDPIERAGLGLAIVLKLAHLLGHHIDVKSTPGKGTVFSIALPSVKTSSLTRNLLGERSTPIFSLNLLKVNILLIDDEENHLHSTEVLLRAWGCTVVTAQSIIQAQKLINATGSKIEIIVADYHLSNNETSLQFVRSMHKQSGGNIPAVIVTGDTNLVLDPNWKSENIHLLYKPVQAAKLRATLSYLVSNKIGEQIQKPNHHSQSESKTHIATSN